MKIHSYTVKKKSGVAKNVNVLTTLDTFQGTTIDDGKDKPAALKLYDYTKGKCSKWVDQLNNFLQGILEVIQKLDIDKPRLYTQCPSFLNDSHIMV